VPSADLILHPVRLRVVQAFLGERVLTTADLRAELPDVPAATLYRHVGVLADAGVLAVAGERKVRGAAERSYRLCTDAASIGGGDAASWSAEEHRRAFTTFVVSLLGAFDRYLDGAARNERAPDLEGDGVGYRQTGLWLTDEEFLDFLTDLREVVAARTANAPGAGRRRRMVSSVLLPGE